MKGRKPTPTALKKMRGTDQPVRINKKEAESNVISKMPPPPKWFGKLARKIYKGKSQELINQGVMGTLDIDMFVLYCFEYATYIETSEEMAKIPYNAKLSESSVEVYRRIRQQNQQAWERAKSIAIEFGFTPSARSRVTLAGKAEKLSEFEKLMKGMA